MYCPFVILILDEKGLHDNPDDSTTYNVLIACRMKWLNLVGGTGWVYLIS